MWPNEVLKVLTALADIQDYSNLWKLVLILCFPEHLGFRISAPGHLEEGPLLRCNWRVGRDAGSPFFLLAWASPAYQGNLGLEPGFKTESLGRSRIYCAEAIGTAVACYNVTLHSHTGSQKLYWREPKRSYLYHPDVDILDPSGFSRLVSHVQRARRAIRVPWEDPQAGLDGILPPGAAELLNTLRAKYSNLINILYHPHTPPRRHRHIPQSLIPAAGRRLAATLPFDLIFSVVEQVDAAELSSLALINSIWNDVANRRLWRVFRLCTEKHTGTRQLHVRLDALLRLPDRARHVRELIIGPHTWQWDVSLLQKLASVWPSMPLLNRLVLEYPSHSIVPRSGSANFVPVLRYLAAHGGSLSLRSFELRRATRPYLLPDSALEQFLLNQPSIEFLAGVNAYYSWGTPRRSLDNFLPNLSRIQCGEELTSMLIASRDIAVICDAGLHDLLERVLRSHPGTGEKVLALNATTAYKPISRLISLAPNIVTLGWRCNIRDLIKDPTALPQFSKLENIVFHDELGAWTSDKVSTWTKFFSRRLRRLLIRGPPSGIWQRESIEHPGARNWRFAILSEEDADRIEEKLFSKRYLVDH